MESSPLVCKLGHHPRWVKEMLLLNILLVL
jgi:hypothetical protein